MELLFLAVMVAGLAYLLLSIFGSMGDAINIDGVLDNTGIDALFGIDVGADDSSNLGCGVIAAFLAGFGAVGVTGTVNGWNVLLMLAVAVAFGWVLGRIMIRVMRFVNAQQSTAVFRNEDLIGTSARVTINSAAGKTGEAIVELGEIRKYAIKEINGAALQRGDTVEIVNINGRFLEVKKKRA